MKASRNFNKPKRKFNPKFQKTESLTIKDKIDSTIQAIEMIRISGQGVITYHFESTNTFDDYSKYDFKNLPENKFGKPIELEPDIKSGSINKWSVSKPINQQIFTDFRGKPEKAENIKMLLIQTCHDIGAKYFTL